MHICRDIHDRESIVKAITMLQAMEVPVGGILFGALLQSPPDVQPEWLEAVDESYNSLHRLYGAASLEFSTVLGQLQEIGSPVIQAAGQLLATRVRQRRHGKLAGSIVYLAAVKWFGDSKASTAEHWIDERDLDAVLAEGILAVKPEVIAGIKRVHDEKSIEAWSRNPRMWHFIATQDTSNVENQTISPEKLPLLDRLQQAPIGAARVDILIEELKEALRNALNLSHDKAESLTGHTTLSELGFDSLMAADLRSWFARELSVNVPILLMLSGSSIREVATEASAKLE